VAGKNGYMKSCLIDQMNGRIWVYWLNVLSNVIVIFEINEIKYSSEKMVVAGMVVGEDGGSSNRCLFKI
jgi:hypothetical protein